MLDEVRARNLLKKRKAEASLDEDEDGIYEVNFDPLGGQHGQAISKKSKRKKIKRSKITDFRDPKNFISNTPS